MKKIYPLSRVYKLLKKGVHGVSKVADIPFDYDGVMGVPITFLDKYNPDLFEILDARDIAKSDKQRKKSTLLIKDADSAVSGKPKYARIVIRNKHPEL